MRVAAKPQRFGDHENAFGFLRLFLASLVIVAHTPELADGNQSREILHQLFGGMTFGALAVDGFFIISGFLITSSALNSSSAWSYLRKRVARIFPAFLVCSFVCVAVIGPLAGGYPENGLLRTVVGGVIRAVLLCPPMLPNTFAGNGTPVLNGSAWTLQYEFACYLLILVFRQLGWLRSLPFVLGASVLCLAIYVAGYLAWGEASHMLPTTQFLFQGKAIDLPRLVGLFLAGSAFFLVQHRIPLAGKWIAVSVVGLIAGLAVPALAHVAVATFGAYLLFAAAALGAKGPLARINNRNDISYGLYLYAWPIGQMIFWIAPETPLLVAGLLTWALASAAGWLSWLAVEQPVMRWARGSSGAARKKQSADLPAEAGR